MNLRGRNQEKSPISPFNNENVRRMAALGAGTKQTRDEDHDDDEEIVDLSHDQKEDHDDEEEAVAPFYEQREEPGVSSDEPMRKEEEPKNNSANESDDGPDEFRRAKVPSASNAPTKRQMQEHLPLHMPYAAWCPDCVVGAATQGQHRTVERTAEEVGTTMSIEFAFRKGDDDEDIRMMPVIVVVDHKTGGLWVIPVDAQGNNELGVNMMTEALRRSWIWRS